MIEQPASNAAASVSAQPPDFRQTWDAGERSGEGRHMGDVAYDRLQSRINEMGQQSPSVWFGAAFTFLGVAVSALLVYVVFPKTPGSIPAGAHGVVATVGIAAGALFLMCLIAYRSHRGRMRRVAQDICTEMDVHSGVVRPMPPVASPHQRRLHLQWPVRWG